MKFNLLALLNARNATSSAVTIQITCSLWDSRKLTNMFTMNAINICRCTYLPLINKININIACINSRMEKSFVVLRNAKQVKAALPYIVLGK